MSQADVRIISAQQAELQKGMKKKIKGISSF